MESHQAKLRGDTRNNRSLLIFCHREVGQTSAINLPVSDHLVRTGTVTSKLIVQQGREHDVQSDKATGITVGDLIVHSFAQIDNFP